MEHMEYINKNYVIVSYDEFLYRFIKKEYPRELTFILTFDDGYNNFYNDIYPILNKLTIPAINFISTGNTIDRSPFWWDELNNINKNGGKLNHAYFTSLTSRERRKILDYEGKKYNYIRNEGNSLTAEQISELGKDPLITFGSHTVTHTNLTAEKVENIRYELVESKKTLEKILKKEVTYFSYPNGDFKEEIIPILKEVGYKSAVLAGNDSFVKKIDNVYKIPRTGAGPYGSSRYWLETRFSTFTYFKKNNKY
jgi:peptidoglycan/xylan/chitin deacetylase (PgdA/CDA1 family)